MDKPIRRRTESGITKFQDAVSDMFNRFFEGPDAWLPDLEGRTWWPLLDIAERENELLVKAELPGMKPEDLNVSVEGNVLTIDGEKIVSEEEKKENFYHNERRFGAFRRTVTLPTSVDADNIQASYDNGVLTIVIPKSEAAKPKKIKVREHALTA